MATEDEGQTEDLIPVAVLTGFFIGFLWGMIFMLAVEKWARKG